MNALLKFALGLANVPPNMVADLEKSIPGVGRLIDAAKQLEPLLEQAHPHIEAITPHLQAAMPHVEALLPLFNRALPIIKAEYPDIVALLPTAQEVVAFLNDKKVPPSTTAQSDPSRSGSG